MAASAKAIESRTQQLGREILARTAGLRPNVFQYEWWDERILQWCMQDEGVRVQLFRFIDVLPQLAGPEAVARHLQEYLGGEPAHLPVPLEWLINFVSPASPAARLAARVARQNALRLARRFVAGATIAQVLGAVGRLRRQKMSCTMDILGEATVSEAEADTYQRRYLELLDGLARAAAGWPANEQIDGPGGAVPRVNLSIKLSALYSQFDPIDPAGTTDAVKGRLVPILRRARKAGAFVNIDMEQYEYKDLTLAIFKQVLEQPEFRDWPHVGIVCQTYLRDAERDLRDLIEWVERRGCPVTVRLVKGAYWDFEVINSALHNWPVPVFTAKRRTDAAFERLAELLLRNHGTVRTAIGSHNVRSIARAIALAEALEVSPDALEFQMLYGMGDPIKHALVELGHRLRVYTPVGELIPGMAYLIRRLLENTSNESFLRRSFAEERPVEELLAAPDEGPADEGVEAAGPAPTADASQEQEMPVYLNQPGLDFSLAENRQRMSEAIARVRGQLGRRCGLLIAGQLVETDDLAESVNPSRPSEVVARVCQADVADADRAVSAAAAAFEDWQYTSAADRAGILAKAAEIMAQRRFELAAWEILEVGKSWREADADVAEAIDFCRYYGQVIRQMSAHPWRRDLPGETNVQFYHPRGVAVVIAPWNFPLAILTGMTAAALATGNCAILKPAGSAAAVAAKLAEILLEAEVPAGVVQLLYGPGGRIGPRLVGHPDVQIIAFTGSREVGLSINRLAAETPPGQHHVKRVIAEMGGKNAVIVDDDADLDEAVKGVVASAFGYQGQKCSACSRVVVLPEAYETFCGRLVQAASCLKVGPAEEPGTTLGPLIDQAAYDKVTDCIARGRRQARVLLEVDVSEARQSGGYFVGPTIFGDADPHGPLAQEEIFGPVLTVLRARDFEQALAIANDTAYALTGGVYSRSPAHIEMARRRFCVGNLYINRKITGAIVGRQPFGGFKLSGIGSKAGGPDYLLQYMVPRTVTENTLRHGFAPSPELTSDQTS